MSPRTVVAILTLAVTLAAWTMPCGAEDGPLKITVPVTGLGTQELRTALEKALEQVPSIASAKVEEKQVTVEVKKDTMFRLSDVAGAAKSISTEEASVDVPTAELKMTAKCKIGIAGLSFDVDPAKVIGALQGIQGVKATGAAALYELEIEAGKSVSVAEVNGVLKVAFPANEEEGTPVAEIFEVFWGAPKPARSGGK